MDRFEKAKEHKKMHEKRTNKEVAEEERAAVVHAKPRLKAAMDEARRDSNITEELTSPEVKIRLEERAKEIVKEKNAENIKRIRNLSKDNLEYE